MPYEELLGWLNYYERRPIGWQDDLRTYYILQAFGEKRKPEMIFPSLGALRKSSESRSPVDSLKGSALFQKMLTATGGDKLDL